MYDIEYKVEIDAPKIEAKFRHPHIIETFDSLKSGEFMKLINNHDPKPLRYQFMVEREDTFLWKYIEEGPDTWQVSIGKK